MTKTAQQSNQKKGESWAIIAMILIGWSSYSFADVSLKLLAKDNFTVWQILNNGAFFSAIAMGVWIYLSRGNKGFIPQEKGWTTLRCIVVAILALSITNAFALVPMADVYGITFAAPFLTLILVFLFLGENVGWHRWLAVAVGFTGVLIIAGPKFAELNWGYLLALNAMVFIAISTIILRKVGKSDHPALYGFYPIVVIFFITLPFTIREFMMPGWGDVWKFA
ncbi:MAG: DMT family transporter, partial [Pseudomonadota bacterium]